MARTWCLRLAGGSRRSYIEPMGLKAYKGQADDCLETRSHVESRGLVVVNVDGWGLRQQRTS